jgi:hypothetical protein
MISYGYHDLMSRPDNLSWLMEEAKTPVIRWLFLFIFLHIVLVGAAIVNQRRSRKPEELTADENR